MRKLLEAAAVEQPVICVLDDVHWGEETFLDLVEQVTALTRDVPLLLVCMGRPELLERRPGWGSRSERNQRASEAALRRAGRAPDRGARRRRPPRSALRERIRGGAEGNPLFVEEMIALVRNAPTAT